MSKPTFNFSTTNPFGLTDVGRNANPTFADIDGDGDLDAFIGEDTGNTLFFRNTGSASSAVFAAATTNPFGLTDVGNFSNPTFADIDGDGDLDAFIGEVYGNTHFIENTGSAITAVFAAATTNPFGLTDVGNFASPTFADIHGDGDLDAFIGEEYGNTRYFENTGSASSAVFTAPIANPFGLTDVGYLANPTFADIDGDGDLDAFIGEEYGNTGFFENTGSASSAVLTAATTNPFGLTDVGRNASPTFADIDGDGDLDAFIGERYGNTLFFTDNSAPTATNLSADETYRVDTALNLTDIVVSDDSANISAILTLSNTAAGDLSTATSGAVTSLYDAGTGVWTASGALQDVNVLLAGVTFFPTASFNGNFSVSTSISDGVTAAINGNKSFTAAAGVRIKQNDDATAVTEGGAADTYTVVLDIAPTADVTITLDNTNQQVSNNAGNLTFTPANWNVAQTVTVIAVNDTVGEGKHTGVIQHTVSSSDVLYNNLAVSPVIIAIADNDLPTAEPTFNFSTTNPFGLTDVGYLASPTFADIDGDGDLDAFIGDKYGDTQFFGNTGSASSAVFAAPSINPFGLTNLILRSHPTFADIDGDGNLDAFIGENYGSTLFFKNTGSASNPVFAAATTNPFGLTDVGYFANPTFADIDSDGDLDAFIGDKYGDTQFFGNTGSASSPVFARPIANPFGLTHAALLASPTFADIDGDGDLDAFIGELAGSTLFFKNTGSASSPAFAAATTNPFGLTDVSFYANPTFADIDGDGDLDAFIGEETGNTRFFITNSAPTATNLSADETYRVDTSLNLTDIVVSDDSANISAILTLSNTAAGDLSTATSGAVTSLYDPGTGVWTASGALSDVNVLLAGVTFIPTASFNGNFSVSTSISDGVTAAIIGNKSFTPNITGPVVLFSTAGDDVLTGTSSLNDTVIYTDATAAVTVSLAITLQQNTISAGLDTLINIEHLFGSGYNDKLTGNWKNNVLIGEIGNDTLNGKAGADILIGGPGNDWYVVDNGRDVVTENPGEGTDTINSSVTYTLPANVERLTLKGSAAIDGTGNDMANKIIGNAANNILNGGAGNDTLDGKTGNNVLTGGTGNDGFKFTTLGHIDTITDFNVANDTIQLENAVFTALTTTGTLTAGQFRIGTQAVDANDFIIYNNATGALLYDANGNGAGAAVQIATIGVGLTMTNAEFVII